MRTRVSRAACLFAVALSTLGGGLGLASQGAARDRVVPFRAPRGLPLDPPARAVASAVPVRPGAGTHQARARTSLDSVPAKRSDGAAVRSLAEQPRSSTAVDSSLAPGKAALLDPASLAAREIARRVRGFHSFRSEIPLARWRTESGARWRVRSTTRCLAAADKLQLPAHPLERPLPTPVPTPVLVTGAIGGVSYRPVQSDRELELSCELATRLPALSALLRAHGVRVAHVNSSYREQPRVSFHTFGLALDIAAFETRSGPLVVATDFELAPDVATCDAKPTSERGRAILALACALADSGLFSSVLTPNYNAGHRDHLHLDIRPDDSRLFLR